MDLNELFMNGARQTRNLLSLRRQSVVPATPEILYQPALQHLAQIVERYEMISEELCDLENSIVRITPQNRRNAEKKQDLLLSERYEFRTRPQTLPAQALPNTENIPSILIGTHDEKPLSDRYEDWISLDEKSSREYMSALAYTLEQRAIEKRSQARRLQQQLAPSSSYGNERRALHTIAADFTDLLRGIAETKNALSLNNITHRPLPPSSGVDNM